MFSYLTDSKKEFVHNVFKANRFAIVIYGKAKVVRLDYRLASTKNPVTMCSISFFKHALN